MRAILAGKPRPTLQAICTARWGGRLLVVYASGNALVILDGPNHILQTIYSDDIDSLDGVAIDEATGKISTCSAGTVQIYRPYGLEDGLLKWSLQCTIIAFEAPVSTPCTLSWGQDEELLVGASYLQLYKTAKDPTLVWKRKLASPPTCALLSSDGGLIASYASYDRLVKLWRRLSSGSDVAQFDFSYIGHPAPLTDLQWRTARKEDAVEHVLYTVSADRKLRIWAATDPHGLQFLQLWYELDLQEAIQPRQLGPESQSDDRYIFLIHGEDFDRASRMALTDMKDINKQPFLEHMADIAAQKPDVCGVIDSKGHLSAWGFHHVGSKNRALSDVFNIALVENFNVFGPAIQASEGDYVRILGFFLDESKPSYSILVHHFDGRVVWLEGRLDEFFDPVPRPERLNLEAIWTGHDGPIKKIIRNVSGSALISRTKDNAALVWRQMQREDRSLLARSSSLQSTKHIHRVCVLADGNLIATLHHHSISLWDTTGAVACHVASCDYDIAGNPLCLLRIPSSHHVTESRYLATVTSQMKGIVWEVKIPAHTLQPTLRQFYAFDLGTRSDLAFVVPIDPAGSRPVLSGFLDTFAKDIALSYTSTGILHTWTARFEHQARRVEWLATAIVNTGIPNPSLASGSSIRKVALVDSTRNNLSIWDTTSGQLEFETGYGPGESIQDLDWTSTPDKQSLLAVGFPHTVLILGQIRYDYLDRGPAWSAIRKIYIREATPHPIGDSTWLGNGSFVVGAGNQLFVFDKAVSSAEDMVTELPTSSSIGTSHDLFDIVALLNGPLPVYHPQFLAQCIIAGKLPQAQKVVVRLNKALKFFTNGDHLDSFLSVDVKDFFVNNEEISREFPSTTSGGRIEDEDPEVVTEALVQNLKEQLANVSVPSLSGQEQGHLIDLVECMATAEKQKRSLDESGLRFLVFFRQWALRKVQAGKQNSGVGWREFAWAFHSQSQDILVDQVSRHFQGRMLWEHARETGIFMWMTDINALKAHFEVIARNEYTKTDERNPVDCSLYYLALKKKAVLLGLWRMAGWHREQAGTQRLLANNFAEARWKTAALKNAYALLGKRRFEYAAAFFLLAGNLKDAVNVCAVQMNDIQLAVAIARVYEGDHSRVLRDLLENRILPQAAHEGNRWFAMWTFWMLGRRDMAVRALITPVVDLLGQPSLPSQQARSYLATDPALVVLYKQLREKTLQTLKGATQILPRSEWEFVMQIARLYDRMGCDILALDLVRNWEFLQQPPTGPPTDEVPNPRLLLRRRSSLVVDDMPMPRSPTAMKTGLGLKPPPPKVFEEPAASSLLDSFGF